MTKTTKKKEEGKRDEEEKDQKKKKQKKKKKRAKKKNAEREKRNPASTKRSKMSDISESEWKKALKWIVGDLTRTQYRKLLDDLTKIPKGDRPYKAKDKLPQMIIEYYGLEESIRVIDEAMEGIPRRDSSIQDKLQPFVKKLGKKAKKRKSDSEMAAEDKKRKIDLKTKEQTAAAGRGGRPVMDKLTLSGQSATVANTQSLRKPIRALKQSSEIDYKDYFGGKVLYKSKLLKSEGKKDYCRVIVADEMDSIKMPVFGKSHYNTLQEGKFYMFRKVTKDKVGFKATSQTIVSRIATFHVPEEVEEEAQLSIKSPFLSIQDCKKASGRVSIEGTVKEINVCEKVEVKSPEKKKKINKQSFHMEDGTGSIIVYFWDKMTQCKKLNVGDVIKLTNMNIKHYYNTVSLQVTSDTELVKVHNVGIRKEIIQIEGIVKCNKRQTWLDVSLNQHVQLLVVSSKSLAEAFGFSLEHDYENQLQQALPLMAEAQIEGNKIIKITRCQN